MDAAHPRNMGPWRFVHERMGSIHQSLPEISYVGRQERASPAEGYPAVHHAEQQRIVTRALGLS